MQSWGFGCFWAGGFAGVARGGVFAAGAVFGGGIGAGGGGSLGRAGVSAGEGSRFGPGIVEGGRAAFRLGPGDRVLIEIAEQEGTAQSCLVMPDGRLYFDLAGGVMARGKTLKELSDTLSARLEEQEDYTLPIVTVNMEEVHSARFQVLGAVNKPGVYPIDKPTRLLDAISTAGGMLNATLGNVTQELAALNRAMVVRGGRALPVDFESLIKEGDMGQNIYVRAGTTFFSRAHRTRRSTCWGG